MVIYFIRLRKYLDLNYFTYRELNINRHIKPIMNVYSFSVITGIYLQLNLVLLGFIKGSYAMVVFSASTKIMVVAMRLSARLGAVLLPKLLNLLTKNKKLRIQ